MNRFLLAAVVAMSFVACSRKTSPTSGPYPPTDPRYPNPGESRYPNPYPSEDNSTTYPTEGQKDGVVTIVRTSDANQENLPPGQAKKKYGGQSAKVYAPGQRKKNGGTGRMATVISVPDMYASRTTSGQLYYNYRGNTYWKQNDGYYHLQDQYNKATTTTDKGESKSKNKGKGKTKNKKQINDNDD
jgi:hypothetical protein